MSETEKQAHGVMEPYNANPELTKMKNDVSNRHFNLTMKGLAIAGIAAIAGAALGAVFLPGLLMVGMEMGVMGTIVGAMFGGVAGLMGGGVAAGVLTMKESKKLAIDEEMVGSYMQGKNHWGAGYRQEVAEHGYAGPQVSDSRPGAVERLTKSREAEQTNLSQRT